MRSVFVLAVFLLAISGPALPGPEPAWEYDPDPAVEAVMQQVESAEVERDRLKILLATRSIPTATRLVTARARLTKAQAELDGLRSVLAQMPAAK